MKELAPTGPVANFARRYQRFIRIGTLGVTFAVVSTLSVLFFQSERTRNVVLMQYETDRYASALLERYRADVVESQSFARAPVRGPSSEPAGTPVTLPQDLLGFALYDLSGTLIRGTGSFPGNVDGALPEGGEPQFTLVGGTVHLVRRLGVLPPGPRGPRPGGPVPRSANELPPGGRATEAQPAGGIAPAVDAQPAPAQAHAGVLPFAEALARPPVRGPVYLFVSRDIRPFFREQHLLEAGMFGVPALAAAILLFIGRLWQRNRRYRERLSAQENLVRLGEAARTLSHEIKNPLSAIRLQTAILRKMHAGDPPREVTLIEEETDQLNRLVERIGDYLRDPLGRPATIDAAQFLQDLVARFDWPVERNAETPVPPLIRFDVDRFRSVLENLLKNAVESGGSRPVQATVVAVRARVEVRVRDFGKGIPDAQLRAIYDPFFTTKTNGSGIGLAIAKRFVEAAGGALEVANADGGGVIARVSLPRIGGRGDSRENAA